MEQEAQKIADQDYKEFISEAADRLKFQVEFAQSALRSLVLVNGGGTLALLTLVGNSSAEFDARSIWFAFLWYGCGLGFALFSYFGAFLSQYYFADATSRQAWNAQVLALGQPARYEIDAANKKGNLFVVLGLGAATLSLVLFVIASFVALGGIL